MIVLSCQSQVGNILMIILIEAGIINIPENFAFFIEFDEDCCISATVHQKIIIYDGYSFTAKHLYNYINNTIINHIDNLNDLFLDLRLIVCKLDSISGELEKIEDEEQHNIECKKQLAKHGLSMLVGDNKEGALSKCDVKEGCLSNF